MIAEWTGDTEVTVGFTFGEDNPYGEDQEALYEHIRTSIMPWSEEL